MLEDLSLNIMDIAENSTGAGAGKVEIHLFELPGEDRLELSVEDDGRGMDEDLLRRVHDPFCTTRTTRRVGLGIPFLKQAAEACGGGLEIASTPGVGTRLKATFSFGHIDRPPLGNIPSTLSALLAGHPGVHWIYRHRVDEKEFVLDSEELVAVLGDPELFRTPDVAQWICGFVLENLEEIGAGGEGSAQDQKS
jgi:hypothetical protein